VPVGILLDADVPPAVAATLIQRGDDAIAASGDVALEDLADDDLLREATRQGRVLVTFNVVDFVEVAHRFAHAQEDHGGIVLIHSRSFPRTAIGAIVDALDRLMKSRDNFQSALIFLQSPTDAAD
jgi:predicted nuclease of predicted toxin-antitoxin system